MINPTYLRTFVELAKTKHFTRTAENLYMTQPGVSQHISKLEHWLGKSLLHRDGKRFELSEAGEQLLLFAEAQQKAEQDLLERIESLNNLAGHCRLACSGALALRIYPALLALQQQQPAFRFSLQAAPAKTIIKEIKSGDVDLGIVGEQLTGLQLEQKMLGQDELCLAVPAGRPGDWHSLLELGFINHPDGHYFATSVLQANYGNEFRGMESIDERGFINQIGQILLPVAKGLGFTVLPRSAWQAFSERDRIDLIELPQPVVETLNWTWKRRKPLAERYAKVMERIGEAFS